MNEEQLWELQKKNATKALDYWIDFIGYSDGGGNPLSTNCRGRLLCIIRLVSWVESHHGTLGRNQPKRDPMQSGNPGDAWWKELTGKGKGKGNRFITAPRTGRKNYWGPELPGAVEPVPDADFDIPAIPWTDEQVEWVRQQLDGHTPVPLPGEGHNSADFTPWMSYFWGVIYLLHCIFGSGYKLEDCSCKNLIEKAVSYNGGGDPKYEDKLNEAEKDINCCEDD
ncbi:MAG: hypothetical protein AB1791_18550 [Chloroflexota bacterium]